MALQAIGEFFMQTRVMGQAVAIAASRGRPMGTLMTFDTAQLVMFGLAGRQEGSHIVMTGRTIACRGAGGEDDLVRRMGRMTGQASFVGHVRRMGFMAAVTGLFAAVIGMATAAVDFQVFAWRRLHYLIDILMTAQTGRFGFLDLAEIEFHRGMGVMAFDTTRNPVVMTVGFGVMTGVAFRDDPFRFGRMGLMAGNAGDFRLMRAAFAFDQIGYIFVTG